MARKPATPPPNPNGKPRGKPATKRKAPAAPAPPPPPAPPAGPRFETVPIASLHEDPANAREHPERNMATITASLARFGSGRSLVLDKNNVVRAGNGTLRGALAEGFTDVLVVEPRPGQLVAVRRPDWSDTEATGYSIADNRSAEHATWNDSVLAETIQALQAEGMDLEAIGFDEAELAHVVQFLAGGASGEAGDDPGPLIDKAEELLEKWGIETGDLWTIPSRSLPRKAHKLLCGDSTNPEDVRRVMGSRKAGLMNTDPPYGVDYCAVKNGIPRSGFRNIQEVRGDIENDDLTDGPTLQAFLESMIRAAIPHLTANPAFYLWHPMLTQGTFFAAAAAAADILIHRQIIWVKPHFVLTRSGMYHWKHELCFYGWIRGKPCEWYGDRSQSSVWELGDPQQDRMHPTQKPVDLFTTPIENHTKIGDVVYEPFAGSGSQLVAAEETSRLCYALEIAPKYCAVILERLSGMGLVPKRA